MAMKKSLVIALLVSQFGHGYSFSLVVETPQEGAAVASNDILGDDGVMVRDSPHIFAPSIAAILEQNDEEQKLALLTPGAFNARLEAQIEKMKLKDKTSKELHKGDIRVVYEDEHIVVVNKPGGVLTVPGKGEAPSLSEAIFKYNEGHKMEKASRMVVHRLGFETTGLIVFAKTIKGMRGMNIRFRTREVDRTYEALVCGHLDKDRGFIDLPLMRCLYYPPFMRVSTLEAQWDILKSGLARDEIGRKYLYEPKKSTTEYRVIAREELNGLPVTRLELDSISGRTHQLNVHMAAFGHPIVGDTVYGVDGDASPNGGLRLEECQEFIPNANRASISLQRQIADMHGSRAMCVHAKKIVFDHPVDKRKEVNLSCPTPF